MIKVQHIMPNKKENSNLGSWRYYPPTIETETDQTKHQVVVDIICLVVHTLADGPHFHYHEDSSALTLIWNFFVFMAKSV